MDDAIQKRLSENQKIFFNKLTNYIEDEIHFYGSIRRFDYIPGKSDIDVDIFTDNENSLIYKLCDLLHFKKNDFRRVVYKINGRIVNGYKCKYDNPENDIMVEMSIYDKNIRDVVIEQHDKASKLPFVVLLFLYILKYFYYKFGIISDDTYKKCKHYLMHMSSERNFIIL